MRREMGKGRPSSGRRNHQPASEPSENLLIAPIAQESPKRAHDSYPTGITATTCAIVSRNPTRRASARAICL